MDSGMIQRKGLTDLFANLDGERMIYVCAPAGYGKTVSVRQWLEHSGCRNAVMTLDEYDNDITHFCVWFCAALRECQPENTALGEIITHPSFDSAPLQFVARAIATLTSGERTRLVIDDIHFLHNGEVLRFLLSCIKRLPDSFLIVLISRNELPVSFSELFVKGRLTCVTAEQLLFSREEVLMLYKKNGVSITPEQAGEVHRFTDGWAIGIGAVLLSGGNPDSESLKHLDEFIKTHVWLRWGEETRDFLLKTSVVQELTPALCTALTDIRDSEKLLDELVRQNAFISCERNGVYRYHRLFLNCLTRMREERGTEFTRNLQNKAGKWYLAERDFYNALDYFIKSESHDGIAQCFGLLVTAGHEYFMIEKLISAVSISTITKVAEKSPYIYSILSWAAFNQGRAAEMALYADMYYANQAEIVRLDPRVKLNIMLVRLIDFRCPLRSLLVSERETPVNQMSATLSGMGVSLGIINQNMPLLHRGTRDFSEITTGDVEKNIAGMKTVLGGLFGDEVNLLAECLTAGILYEQGYLEKAYAHALAANSEIKEHFVPEVKFCAMSVLFYVLYSLKQDENAGQTINRISDMIEKDRAYYLNYNLSALAVRHKLINGDTEAARVWLSEYETPLNNGLDFHRLYGHLTTCRAYITRGDYIAAIILLSKILELVTEYNRPLDMIETQILLAIACWKEKRTLQSESLRHLEQAVLLAYNYGYTQIFVTMGAELSGMLHRLQNRAEQRIGENHPPTNFVKMLYIKAAEHTSAGLTSGQPVKRASFTDKQKAVMRLLCEGRSYREATVILGIKLPTLRSHISLIYKKLDVTNEADAIKKIMSQGILDES